jgi:hypothetical protein|tara:strand:+ start:66 stop:356 length:291 start_codon:yes stop_codon:yes gene_type:complete
MNANIKKAIEAIDRSWFDGECVDILGQAKQKNLHLSAPLELAVEKSEDYMDVNFDHPGNDGLDHDLLKLEYALNVNSSMLIEAANVVRRVNQEVTA